MRRILLFLAFLVAAEPAYACGLHVLIFDAWWCHVCKHTKRYLDSHGISYDTIQVTENPNHWNYVLRRNFGIQGVPVTVIDGDWDRVDRTRLNSSREIVIGFNENKLREALCLAR